MKKRAILTTRAVQPSHKKDLPDISYFIPAQTHENHLVLPLLGAIKPKAKASLLPKKRTLEAGK